MRATFERLLDPATRSPGAALFDDIVGAKAFAAGESPHLRGVRANGGQITFTLKRSDPAFLARLAMPIACPVESGTPHREVPGLLARSSTGRYRVVESSSSLIDLRRVPGVTGFNLGGTPGAAARISIERLADVTALEAAIRSGEADLSLDDLPLASSPDLATPSSGLAVLRLNPAKWPLSDEGVRRALSLALDRRALAEADGGDVVAARSLLVDPQAPGALPADTATARALLRRAGAEGTLRLALWAEPGAQARIARAIGVQLAANRGTGRRARGAAQPSGRLARARGSSGSTPPMATPRPSSCRSPTHSRRARRRRSQSACTEPRGWPAMRAGPRSGVSTSASAPVALAQFRCCVQTFLHRSRPCWWEEAPIRCSTSTSPCFSTRS